MAEIPNPTITIPVEMPLHLASILGQKPQWCFSERQYGILMDVLTDEQKVELFERIGNARPVIFPHVSVVMG